MREFLTYGSVRGAAREGRPYRDPFFRSLLRCGRWGMLPVRATILAQPLRSSPSEDPGEAKGGIPPDRHTTFVSPSMSLLGGGGRGVNEGAM